MSACEVGNDPALSCQVAIVGLGPVGATLATLLGQRGVDVIAVEPERTPAPYPRAIAADAEMLRTFLRLPGLPGAEQLFDMGQRVQVRDANQRIVTTITFDDAALGVPGLSFFHQPSLERAIRAALARQRRVRACWGRRVTQVEDTVRGAAVELDDGSRLAAQWVVACDGAGSGVRRQRRIPYVGRTFSEPWIVIDIDSPEPLRHLPYFSYVLDPGRPAVNMPRPGGHRFEFMVLPGEDPAATGTPDQVQRWLEPYLAPLPARARARLTTVRAAPYTFHARTAARWRDGRVLLAGDAAHCMPPFGGQGLGAGIGDALTLAWRLGEVCEERAPATILDDYERERRPRVAEMTRTALVAGKLLTSTKPLSAAATTLGLRAVSAAPVIGRRFRAGSLRSSPAVPVPWRERRLGGGRPLPNASVRTRQGLVVRIDDLLGGGWALLIAAGARQQLPADLAAKLRKHDAVELVVAAPGQLPADSSISRRAVEDLDGALLDLWRRHPGGYALVRPDRFLAGVGSPDAIGSIFDRLTGGSPAAER